MNESALDRSIQLGCVGFIFFSIWSAMIPVQEGGLPLPAMVMFVITIIILLFVHMVKHLGLKMAIIWYVLATALEWMFEETNIRLGGFVWGDLRYTDVTFFGPKLLSVPILVPLLMATIIWPTYVGVNMLLDGKVVVDLRKLGLPSLLTRCAIYGMVHSWYMFLGDPICMQWGLYEWVGHSAARPEADMFLGDPRAPFGWAVYVGVVMLMFALVLLPRYGANVLKQQANRTKKIQDLAPILFMFGTASMVAATAANLTVANVVFWTIGFFAVLVIYKYIQDMKLQDPS